jgi:hypothetical protein
MNGYLRACHGKHPFHSRRAARRRARQIRGQGGPRFNTYRCRPGPFLFFEPLGNPGFAIRSLSAAGLSR